MSGGVVLLCSGGGGNLRFVDACIDRGIAPGLCIVAVLTDRDCGASDYAMAKGIPTRSIDFAQPAQRALIDELQALGPSVVVTTVHRILAPEVVDAFRGRLINLHYSLLPAFSGSIGTTPVRQALEYGARFVGTTVHFVDDVVDAGRPIIQSATPVFDGDRTEDVMDSVFRCGCISLMHALDSLGATRQRKENAKRAFISASGRLSFFSPSPVFRPEYESDAFWDQIRLGGAAMNPFGVSGRAG